MLALRAVRSGSGRGILSRAVLRHSPAATFTPVRRVAIASGSFPPAARGSFFTCTCHCAVLRSQPRASLHTACPLRSSSDDDAATGIAPLSPAATAALIAAEHRADGVLDLYNDDGVGWVDVPTQTSECDGEAENDEAWAGSDNDAYHAAWADKAESVQRGDDAVTDTAAAESDGASTGSVQPADGGLGGHDNEEYHAAWESFTAEPAEHEADDDVPVVRVSMGSAKEEEFGPVWSGSSKSRQQKKTLIERKSKYAPARPGSERAASEKRRAESQLVRRLTEEARLLVSQQPVSMLASTPLSMDVVMAPGDSKPRIPCSQRLTQAEPLPEGVEDAIETSPAQALLESIDAAPYPMLSPIARLAPGLEDVINVRGVLRVGDTLTPEERARGDDAPMLPAGSRGDAAASPLISATSASSAASSTPAASSSLSSAAPSASSSSDLSSWTSGFGTAFEHIVHPHLVDLSSFPGSSFVTSSRDKLLLRLAREQRCTLMSSTSSTTRILSHLIFSLTNFHEIRSANILSPDFEPLPKRPTSAERSPALLFFRKRKEGQERLKDVESPEEEARVREEWSVRVSTTAVDDGDGPSSTESIPISSFVPPVWAVDSAPSYSNAANRILQELGHTMEAAFTHDPEEFAREFMKRAKRGFVKPKIPALSTAGAEPVTQSDEEQPAATQQQEVRDAFLFIKMGGLMFRSQLDCVAPELRDRKELQSFLAPCTPSSSSSASSLAPTLPFWPGWEHGGLVFDLKTRATLPIRLFCRRYNDLLDYHLLYARGLLYSFEREYYDLQRSAFLKYSLQCRIGRMGGVVIGYHNTSRMYAMHYVSLKEMDEALTGHSLVSEWAFASATGLLNKHFAGHGVDRAEDALLDLLEEEWEHNWRHRKRMMRQMAQDEAESKQRKQEEAALDKFSAGAGEFPLKEIKPLSTPSDDAVIPASSSAEDASAADFDPIADAESLDAFITEYSESAAEIDNSPPPSLSTLKVVVASSQHAPDLVQIFVEMLPLRDESPAGDREGQEDDLDAEDPSDPQGKLPFLKRYTSQRRLDALPNYRIRGLLKQMDLSTQGNRADILSRLEAALAPRPQEPLPDLDVFLQLARMNLIHKFVLKIQVSGRSGVTKQPESASASVFATGADGFDSTLAAQHSHPGASPGVDPLGQSIIDPQDMNVLLEQWAQEYKRRDREAQLDAMAPEARQAAIAQAATVDDDLSASTERSAGSRCPPISAASLASPPSSHVSVSSSVTHVCVRNGGIDAMDLASEYRMVLEQSLRVGHDGEGDAVEGDMMDALRMSMQDLVASQSRVVHRQKQNAAERKERAREHELAALKHAQQTVPVDDAANADAPADEQPDAPAELPADASADEADSSAPASPSDGSSAAAASPSASALHTSAESAVPQSAGDALRSAVRQMQLSDKARAEAAAAQAQHAATEAQKLMRKPLAPKSAHKTKRVHKKA